MRRRNLPIVIVLILSLLVVGCARGTGSSSRSTESIPTSAGGGGSGGAGGNPPAAGGTVPGNVQIGLAESPEAPRISGGTSAERQVADDVNAFRQQNGLGALVWSDAIADAERSHAYDCEQLGYFGHGANHAPGDYNLCVQRGQFLDLPGSLWECGYGGGASGAVSGWANSSAHRSAILDATLKYHGVGIGSGGTPVFWASLR
jgi:uncharacterized protein YkwD